MTIRALGIDVGTTSTKAVVVDESGQVKAVGSGSHAAHTVLAPGRVEIAAERWEDSLMGALSTIKAAGEAAVDVIGLSGNMSSVLLVDRHGNADGPAVLLADGRGAGEISRLSPELRERVHACSGNYPAVVFSLSTLLWLVRHAPERLGAGVFCAAKDWLRMRLCDSETQSEVTDAFNTLLVDRHTLAWDTGLAETLGIPVTALPPLRRSDEIVGRISVEAAQRTGLRAGTPVVAGGGDMACLALGGGFGTGGVTRTTGLVSLGTAVTVILPTGDAARPGPGATWHPYFDAGSAYALSSLVTGGMALNWLSTLTGTRLAEIAPSVLPIDDPLVLMPHLSGVASPEERADVRGAILGLDVSTGPSDLASALFEALAFELGRAVEMAGGVGEVVLTGGGVRVPGWVGAIAETLPATVSILDEPEASARGAALLGLRGLGLPPPAPPTRRVVCPDPARALMRSGRRERYFEARELLFHHYHHETR